MSDENSAPELIAPVSGVVLSLMAHLRHSTLPSGEALESLSSRGAMASGWLDDGKFNFRGFFFANKFMRYRTKHAPNDFILPTPDFSDYYR